MLRFTPNIVRLGISALSLLAAIAVYLLLRLEPPALLEPSIQRQVVFVEQCHVRQRAILLLHAFDRPAGRRCCLEFFRRKNALPGLDGSGAYS